MEKISETIFYIPEITAPIFPFMTGNVYVLVDQNEHTFSLIDSGFTEPFAKTVIGEIKSLGLRFEDLQWIYHTHSHSDHWGNDHAFLQLAPKAKIGFHKSAQEYVRDQVGWLHKFELLTPNDKEYVASFSEALKTTEPVEIDTYLSEGTKLSIGQLSLAVMHVPGHERDNLAYYASDFGILVSGSYLRDIKASWTYSVQGGGLSAVKKTFDRLEKLKFHVALPNHGRPLLSEDEVRKAFDRARDMLAIRDRSILKALGKGPRSFTALLKEFPAIPRLHPWYMERIMLAHLVALQETGAVEKFGETWRRL